LIFRVDSDLAEFLIGIGTVAIGICSAPYIESYFRRLTDQFFFKNQYVYAEALEELCHILNTTIRIPQLIGLSLHTLNDLLKPSRIEFIYARNGERYDINGELALPFEPQYPDAGGVRIPIQGKGRMVGELLLWPKRSGDPYTREDMSLLRTFA